MPLISRCCSPVGPGDAGGSETLVLADLRLPKRHYNYKVFMSNTSPNASVGQK